MGSIRTPMAQTFVLGMIFFFTFTAYLTIQAFASDMYGQTLGSNTAFSIYALFTIACFISPSITNKLGCKNTMTLGVLGYASLVAASLIKFVDGTDKYNWLVIVGGCILGIGAALLWTAQGRLILQYSDGSDGGTLFSIFWALFNMSALVGGLLTFVYFGANETDDDSSDKDEGQGSATLYVIFLGFVLSGAFFTRFIVAPNDLERPADSKQRPFLDPLVAEKPLHHDIEQQKERHVSSEISGKNWVAEFIATIALFKTERMLLLATLFYYTGYNQPYQLNTFGNRFFTAQTLGLEMIIFYAAEIVGGLYIGQFLDKSSSSKELQRKAAKTCLLVFVVVTSVSFVLAFYLESKCAWKDENCVDKISYDSVDVILPTITYALWGFSDSQIQTYSYWLMGVLYETGDDQARAVGFYKMIQSAGWMVGFWFVPNDRMEPVLQMGGTTICFAIGLVLCLRELPK